MATDSKIMARALARYRRDVERRRERQQIQAETILRTVPRAAEIQRELRGTVGQIVAAAFRRGADPTSAIQALKERNLALQRERAEVLVANGLPFDALDDKPGCPRCGDTGFTEEGPCRCLMAYYTREQNKELSKLLDLGGQSFDTFAFHWYSTVVDPKERVRLRQLLAELAQDRIILVATHVVSDVETVAKEILLLKGGRLVAQASVASLVEQYAPGGSLEDVYLHVFGEEGGA